MQQYQATPPDVSERNLTNSGLLALDPLDPFTYGTPSALADYRPTKTDGYECQHDQPQHHFLLPAAGFIPIDYSSHLIEDNIFPIGIPCPHQVMENKADSRNISERFINFVKITIYPDNRKHSYNRRTVMSFNTRKRVTLHDKTFELFIPYTEIEAAIERVADKINADYRTCDCPLFLGVLNGSFMFMADLMKRIDFNCELSFVKLASYEGTSTTGKISELIGLNKDIEGRDVIIVEDIVDTGESIEHMCNTLQQRHPKSIRVATMLFKPGSYKKGLPIHYGAMEIPNDFIVGYGLDYNQLGRNLRDIYKIVDE